MSICAKKFHWMTWSTMYINIEKNFVKFIFIASSIYENI